MIFWLDDNLFQEPAIPVVDLLALLRLAWLHRHPLYISGDPLQPWPEKVPCFEKWQESLSVNLAGEIDDMKQGWGRFDNNQLSFGTNKPIGVSHRSDSSLPFCILTIKQALLAVSLSFGVLLENQLNDAAFLRRTMSTKDRKKFDDWEKQGRLRYLQGGGINELRRLVEYFGDEDQAKQAFGLPVAVWQHLHFVVYDHDGNAATLPSIDSQRLQNLLQEKGMTERSHQLQRRTQEHYLSRSTIERCIDNDKRMKKQEKEKSVQAVATLFTLPLAEQHFSDYKKLPFKDAIKNAFFDHRNDPGFWPTTRDATAEQEVHALAEKIAAAM